MKRFILALSMLSFLGATAVAATADYKQGATVARDVAAKQHGGNGAGAGSNGRI